MENKLRIASGFDFEPLTDGNLLIEFFNNDGKSINTQIVTPELVRQMPLVAALTDVAIRKGPEAAKQIMERLHRE